MSETLWSTSDDPWDVYPCRGDDRPAAPVDIYDTPEEAVEAWVPHGAHKTDGSIAQDVLLYRWDDLEQTPTTLWASSVCDVRSIIQDAYPNPGDRKA